MAIISNLTVDQGSTFNATIDVTDTSGSATNLTDFSVAGQVRKTYSSITAINFVSSITDAANGVVSISLSDTVTNNMKAGRYVYDVEILSSGGTRTRVLEGQLEVTPGVTQI
jgi:hypothetical protein